jgi:hypothetical protein
VDPLLKVRNKSIALRKSRVIPKPAEEKNSREVSSMSMVDETLIGVNQSSVTVTKTNIKLIKPGASIRKPLGSFKIGINRSTSRPAK